jgi:hypothetical protein
MNDENAEIRYMEKRSGYDQRNQMLSPLGQEIKVSCEIQIP